MKRIIILMSISLFCVIFLSGCTNAKKVGYALGELIGKAINDTTSMNESESESENISADEDVYEDSEYDDDDFGDDDDSDSIELLGDDITGRVSAEGIWSEYELEQMPGTVLKSYYNKNNPDVRIGVMHLYKEYEYEFEDGSGTEKVIENYDDKLNTMMTTHAYQYEVLTRYSCNNASCFVVVSNADGSLLGDVLFENSEGNMYMIEYVHNNYSDTEEFEEELMDLLRSHDCLDFDVDEDAKYCIGSDGTDQYTVKNGQKEKVE